MTHYAALDVSLRTVSVCVMDGEGQIKGEAKLPTELEVNRPGYLGESIL